MYTPVLSLKDFIESLLVAGRRNHHACVAVARIKKSKPQIRPGMPLKARIVY